MWCCYSKEQIVGFLALFYRLNRPSDVLIKKKKKKGIEMYGKVESQTTV